MDDKGILRIGMIGTGRITERFVSECHFVEGIMLVAVFNPHPDSALNYIIQRGLNEVKAFDELEDFLNEIDAVYIASPHNTHYEYAVQSILAGKHVLCEKPLCLKGEETKKLFSLAKENKVVLMEAVKTAYCPGFLGILELVKSGKIGEVHDVEACFTRLGNAAVRETWDLEYGGSFTEFGTYTLLPVVKILGTQNNDTHFWSLPAKTGVDSYTKATITYENAIATIKTGTGVKSEGQLIIAGSNGYILVPSPWWLTKHVEVHFEDPRRVESYDFPFEGAGLRYEIKAFMERIKSREISDGTESIWMAEQMEAYRKQTKRPDKVAEIADLSDVKVWAHRGCSTEYPENTLAAFEAAAKLPGLTGIELDVQLTSDGEVVVIHDEKVDRTTTGTGEVRGFTLSELKRLAITGSGCSEALGMTVPTLREVFELLKPYCMNGLMINIELKNSVIRYEGMEEKVIALVKEYNLEENIVYSSFLHESMGLIKELCPSAKTGTLSTFVTDCLQGAVKNHADALHPSFGGLDINLNLQQYSKTAGMPVRAWGGGESFFGQPRKVPAKDLRECKIFGVTDIITNVPERYLL